MKLLFDHNLFHRLVRMLRDVYPDSVHVRDLDLDRAPDEVVWEYARTHGFTIVSEGFPPNLRVTERSLRIDELFVR